MEHPYGAKASFDGGDLDCGSGLLLLIRRHIDPLAPGELLEIRSREISVNEELPAWCRMTGNELVSQLRQGAESSFLVSKGPFHGAVTNGSSMPLPRIGEPKAAEKAVAAAPAPRPLPAPHCPSFR